MISLVTVSYTHLKGTTVHFRATHSKSWTIMYWKFNGVIIRSVEPEQTFVIDEHKEVRVAFKPYKSPEPEGLYLLL